MILMPWKATTHRLTWNLKTFMVRPVKSSVFTKCWEQSVWEMTANNITWIATNCLTDLWHLTCNTRPLSMNTNLKQNIWLLRLVFEERKTTLKRTTTSYLNKFSVSSRQIQMHFEHPYWWIICNSMGLWQKVCWTFLHHFGLRTEQSVAGHCLWCEQPWKQLESMKS